MYVVSSLATLSTPPPPPNIPSMFVVSLGTLISAHRRHHLPPTFRERIIVFRTILFSVSTTGRWQEFSTIAPCWQWSSRGHSLWTLLSTNHSDITSKRMIISWSLWT